MFEKFTEKAKRILFLARYEASQHGAKQIGTEHILLGLLKEGEDTTRELFTRANVSTDLLQRELERHGPAREKLSTSVEIPFSEETKRVLQFAEEEAEQARRLASAFGSPFRLRSQPTISHTQAKGIQGKYELSSGAPAPAHEEK